MKSGLGVGLPPVTWWTKEVRWSYKLFTMEENQARCCLRAQKDLSPNDNSEEIQVPCMLKEAAHGSCLDLEKHFDMPTSRALTNFSEIKKGATA